MGKYCGDREDGLGWAVFFFYCLLAGNPDIFDYDVERHLVSGVRCLEQCEVGDVLYAEWDKTGMEYFNTETLKMQKTEMFIEGYKAGLVKAIRLIKGCERCRLRCGSFENIYGFLQKS